jgi:hypothetical protein
VMVGNQLSRAMYQMRFENPNLYQRINVFWKKEIGEEQTLKFKFVLMYLVRVLEDYLRSCEEHYKQLSQAGGSALPIGVDPNPVMQLKNALKDFVPIETEAEMNAASKAQRKSGEDGGPLRRGALVRFAMVDS